MIMNPETNPYDATLMIIYDKGNQKVLLSERPNGDILFPSEKGVHAPLENARRGMLEEMGIETILESTILPLTIAHNFKYEIDYEDKVGMGTASAVLITEWDGEIRNIDTGKDNFFWVDENQVMEWLSWDESKFFYLIALTELYAQKIIPGEMLVQALGNAPKLRVTLQGPSL